MLIPQDFIAVISLFRDRMPRVRRVDKRIVVGVVWKIIIGSFRRKYSTAYLREALCSMK